MSNNRFDELTASAQALTLLFGELLLHVSFRGRQ